MSTHTSQAMARELADKLKKWLAATMPFCTESNDADGNPTILFADDATPATTEAVILIRIKQVENSLAKDVLGNTAIQYGPHRIQILTETDSDVTAAQLLSVLVETGRTGARVEQYASDAGTVPAVAALDTEEDAGTTVGLWFPLYWNNLATS